MLQSMGSQRVGHMTEQLNNNYVLFDSFSTPVDYSPPGSSVHGISQAIILEWAAISFSRGFSQPRN